MYNKNNNELETNLKKFYNESETYLSILDKHDKATFSRFVNICKKNIPKESRIRDCGCGTGLSSYLLSKLEFNVTGIDISNMFISKAKEKYSDQGKIKYYVENIDDMSFSDDYYDAVCCYNTLEHVCDVEKSLNEMCRVLKKGGLLIILTPSYICPSIYLHSFFHWENKIIYKPWEARSKYEALSIFLKNIALIILKEMKLNKEIYYLKPFLSNNEVFCGKDYDATWLTNWFDIEYRIRKNNLNIPDNVYYDNKFNRTIKLMKLFKIPKCIQLFYIKMVVKRISLVCVKK